MSEFIQAFSHKQIDFPTFQPSFFNSVQTRWFGSDWGARLFWVGIALTLFWGGLRFNGIPVGSFFDDAHYIVLAEGLASGQGYRLVNYPDNRPEPAFPPGWSLLLVPLVYLIPDNFLVLKLFSFGLWLGALCLVYYLFKPRLPDWQLGLLVVMVAVNPHLVGMASTVMSETPYLFFSLLALTLLMKWQQRPFRWLLLLALGVTCYAFFIRTVGITLVLGVGVSLLWQRWRRWVVVAFALGGLLLLLLLWLNGRFGLAFLPFSELYGQHIFNVSAQLGRFLRFWHVLPHLDYETVAHAVVPGFILERVGNLLTVRGVRWLSILLLGVIGLGWGFAWRQAEASEWYVGFYLLLLYLWFTYINEVQLRQLLPLLPFLYFYLLQALNYLSHRLVPSEWQERLVWAISAMVILLALGFNGYNWQRPERERIADLRIGTTWLRQNSPTEAVIMTEDSVPEHLYMRRQTVGYAPYDELAAHMAFYGVDYVMLRPSIEWWDTPYLFLNEFAQDNVQSFIEDHPAQFKLVYYDETHLVTIYEVQSLPPS